MAAYVGRGTQTIHDWRLPAGLLGDISKASQEPAVVAV